MLRVVRFSPQDEGIHRQTLWLWWYSPKSVMRRDYSSQTTDPYYTRLSIESTLHITELDGQPAVLYECSDRNLAVTDHEPDPAALTMWTAYFAHFTTHVTDFE
jgi:hypothetical protein